MLNFSSLICLRTRHVSQNRIFVHLQVYLWANRLYPLLLTLKRKKKKREKEKGKKDTHNQKVTKPQSLQFFTVYSFFIYLGVVFTEQLFQASHQVIYPFCSFKSDIDIPMQEWIFFYSLRLLNLTANLFTNRFLLTVILHTRQNFPYTCTCFSFHSLQYKTLSTLLSKPATVCDFVLQMMLWNARCSLAKTLIKLHMQTFP